MKNKDLNNNLGQTIVEAVLILSLFVLIGLTLSQQFKDNELLAQLVSGPWDRLDGMIQNGVWEPTSEGDLKHPNRLDKHLSTHDD